MKRILSLILGLMMCLSVTAFADDYDILNTQYKSYKADISVTMTVNEPMTVLNLIAEASGMENVINLQLLAESLMNSSSTGVVKLNSNEDYTKMTMSYEVYSVTPMSLNRNLSLTAEMAFGMWLEWDITDELNPVIKYVTQQPFSDKYISVDVAQMLKNQGVSVPDLISSIKGYLSKERIDELNGKFVDIIRNNSSISAVGNRTAISLTAEQLENLIAEYMDVIIAEFDDNEDFDLLHDGDFGFVSDIFPDSEQIKEFFEEVKLFDETALTMEFVKNPNGTIKNASAGINMSIELAEALNYMEIEPVAGVPSTLKFSVNASTAYSSVNSSVKVDFPELTAENSISLEDYINSYNAAYEDYEWNGESCPHYEYDHVYCDYLPAAKDTFYISLSKLTSTLRNYGYDYVINRNAESVVLTDEARKDRFCKTEMTIGSNDIYIDGALLTLANPVTVSGGEVYIDTNAIKYIFDLDMSYASVDLETNELSASFERKSPQCHHTEEEMNALEYAYDESGECEHYQIVYVSSDYPYDGTGYFKIRDVLDEIYYYDAAAYSIAYDNGVVTVTDESASQGFSSIVITAGSSDYVLDGTAVTVGKGAVEYLDSMYIDDAAAEALFGFKVHSPRLHYIINYNEDGMIDGSYMSYNARLVRKAPYCVHSDEELEDYYKWWE